MNPKIIASLLLIALGVIALAYSGLNFATPGRTINFLGLHLATTDSHFIPPILGVFALAGGLILLLVKPNSL